MVNSWRPPPVSAMRCWRSPTAGWRERLAARCALDGVRPWTVRAANVVVLDDVDMGAGGILCPFVTLTSNIRIGCSFHANLYSYVANDCLIGDYVTFARG
jgi:acetyltransferase-like isoleucine patch superfamily enzyme